MKPALVELPEKEIETHDLLNPKGYKGIYGFHKYWGKKPLETYAYLIESLSSPGDIVCDPFLGSGVAGLQSYLRKRRFLGNDLNPISVKLSKFMLCQPTLSEFKKAFLLLEKNVRSKIDASYNVKSLSEAASHFLWDKDELKEIWVKKSGSNKKNVLKPDVHDLALVKKFSTYKCKKLRNGTFFQNSRINSKSTMTLRELFCGRALRNIEIILQEIDNFEGLNKDALLLCLTAAAGQMSQMVFAITKRSTNLTPKTEVGSWVIGYWRPKLHFEINVWNCFSSRAKKLMNALTDSDNKVEIASTPVKVLSDKSLVCISQGEAINYLTHLPQSCLDLILTDPPHSDRIPYLELSELWNVLIGETTSFKDEIVVTNAKERKKGKQEYAIAMLNFFEQATRTLKKDGVLALMFNARDNESWEFFDLIKKKNVNNLVYRGHFKVTYSATSVVQDNRQGSLQDLVLIFTRSINSNFDKLKKISSLPSWSTKELNGD